MKNVKFENGKLIVSTTKGDIVVSVEGNERDVNVCIDFQGEQIKDRYAEYIDNKAVLPLVMVQFDEDNKELKSLTWENSLSGEATHIADHSESLIYDEDFYMLPVGTKVVNNKNNKIGYVVGNNADECHSGYQHSLEYKIKYALEDESYEDVLNRIKSSDSENEYDIIELWENVMEFKLLDLTSLRNTMCNDEFINGFADRLLESYSQEELKNMEEEKLVDEIFNTLMFSYSSVVTNFIEDNKFYFSLFVYGHITFDRYIDEVLVSGGNIKPFDTRQPIEFFDFIKEFAQKLLLVAV